MTEIINGKKIANNLKISLKKEVNELRGRKPSLSVILIGDNPASQTYVRIKEKIAKEIGILSKVYVLDKNVSQKEVISLIQSLNKNKKVDGILLQLPIPPQIKEEVVLKAIDPKKDVDGLNPLNKGFLFNSENKKNRFVPCTALAILHLIQKFIKIKGKKAVIVGRSNIVGKPTGQLLLENNATVCFCHSYTKNLKKQTLEADILVVALGKPKFIKKDMVKKGAMVIDVGINKLGNKLIGDVDFEKAKEKAGFITPVPGGVGPMTVIMLMKNTLKARKMN